MLSIHPLLPASILLPLLARPVPAGFPSPADDHVEEEIDLHRLLVRNRAATFLVRVAGHSMLEAHLHDGDIAVDDRSVPPAPGDVVVVDVDGDRSFKVWTGKGQAPLAFANRALAPFDLPSGAAVQVWGTVTGSVCARRRAHRG